MRMRKRCKTRLDYEQTSQLGTSFKSAILYNAVLRN